MNTNIQYTHHTHRHTITINHLLVIQSTFVYTIHDIIEENLRVGIECRQDNLFERETIRLNIKEDVAAAN